MSQSKDPTPHDSPKGATVQVEGKIEGVVASSINLSGGKNKIIGQLHKTIHMAVNFAGNMVSYAARIKGVDVRMRDIADRVRATSSILHDIEILFEQLASNPTAGSSKVPDAANDLYAELQSCETWLRAVKKQMSEFMEGVPDPRRLEGKEREKVELAQDSLVLLETNITAVDVGIQDHKQNLQIRLYMFSLSFWNQKPDLTWSDMISDMLSELRRILSELGLLRNGIKPKTVRSPSLGHSNSSQLGGVPAPTAFNPRYAGWVLQRGTAHGTIGGKSWLTPDTTPLAFSSEQLYLQVVNLMVEDGKRNQTLHNTYNRLGAQRQNAVSGLLARQNQELQKRQPSLEWTLAGIQTKVGSILVILKTELKPYISWESSKDRQVPYLRGGAGGRYVDFEDESYPDRHTSGARHVYPDRHTLGTRDFLEPRRHGRAHEYHREMPEDIPHIYNTHAGPSHDARQHYQRNTEAGFEKMEHQQYFTSANSVSASGSRLAGVLWSARLNARARAYHGKGKARAHEIGIRNDDELIHALVEDWYEVVSVWPRSHLTASYNIAETAVPGFTHGTPAYRTAGTHQYATNGTYSRPTFAVPVHGDRGMPAHDVRDRRRQTGPARRQGRVITLQAIIGISRQRRREDGGRR